MSLNTPRIEVRVTAVHEATAEVKLFELAPVQALPLPAAEPGAHIDLHLPGGEVRQYSLLNRGSAPASYRIGVKREVDGRGGSRWLHDVAAPGQALAISAPRNHFALHAGARHSILVAGGIGITPIFNMAMHLHAGGAPWELHYGTRSRAHCALHDELMALDGPVHLYFDDVQGPGAIPLAALAARASRDAGIHLYACGPQGLLEAYERACADIRPRAHLEHFAAPPPAGVAPASSFVVVLAKSGREIQVPPDKSILECLHAAGLDVPYSCSQGVCGSCETRVLAGTPEHRDVVLSDDERAGNRTMMVCCSRARSPRLALDL